jgi:chemotaxis protein CheY-P-specific phosphatase CheC
MASVSPFLRPSLAQDALCELVSIGSGNALTSLNRLLGRGRIDLAPCECLDRSALAAPGDLDCNGVVVRLRVHGMFACDFLTLLADEPARRLAAELLHRSVDVAQHDGMAESGLLEAVNIISCSFLGALGSMVRGVLVPGPPEAAWGNLSHELERLWQEMVQPLAFSARFADDTVGFHGRIVLVAEVEQARVMLRALGVAA